MRIIINHLLSIFVIGMILSQSIYHFFIFLKRKDDSHHLIFSLFAAFLAISILAESQLLSDLIKKDYCLTLEGICSAITLTLSFIFSTYFFFHIIEYKGNRIEFYICFTLMGIAGTIVALSTFIFGYDTFENRVLPYTTIVVLLSVLLNTFFLLKWIINMKKYQKQTVLIVLIGILIIPGCIIIDCIIIFFTGKAIDFYLPIGLSIVVFSYALTEKFNNEYIELKILKTSLEQKVQDRTMELEQEKENKIRFFINAAHETKTPLTLIKNYLDEVIQKHNLGRDRDMRVVRDNVLKLETDMLNFLDNEKIERGEMVYFHDQIIDFSQFTRDKIDLFKPVFEKKALDFQCEIRDKIYLRANSQSLDRVLNNLFDNAVKYTPQGGQVKIQLKLSWRKILLNVTNSGSILCDTEIKDIFNPYYQVNREKSNAQGMGLGLYIVKNIVQSLEGEIEVQSSNEEGTTVSIKLKSHALKKSDVLSDYQLEQPRDAKVLDLENREQNPFHKNILLVEDDLPLLEILYRHLREDYNVFCAVNGRDALDLLESMVSIDLIICDIMMDVMDGYELLHRLPRSHVHIPFLFITAKTTQAAKTAGLKQGAVDFIYKPFTIAELKHKIKNHLDQAAKIHARAKKSMDHRLDSHKKKVNRAEEFELLCKKYKLTPSEIKIVSLFGEGFDNKDLARKLDVSVRTVHNHTRNIFKKVEVRSRIELLNKMKFFH